MPVLNGKELRIVGFLCNWCSYGGADTAGVARATQPTDLRVIRVPCSGRIDPLFIVKALLNGADGVLVSGCHPRDCHYAAGNFYARRRLEVLKQFLPVLGIDERRFEYTWVSASEGQRWQQVVTVFTDRIHKLGPAPKLEDPEPLLKIADMALTSLRSLGTGQNAALAELKEAMEKSTNVGMQTFDQALYDLYKAGKITLEAAIKNADSANNLRLRVKLSEEGGFEKAEPKVGQKSEPGEGNLKLQAD